MDKNKIVAYSLLSHINNNGEIVKDLIDVFVPLVKRAISIMNSEGVFKGKNISEIQSKLDTLYKLDIPISVLRIVLNRIAQSINKDGKVSFTIYKDDAYAIQNYTFTEFDELIKNKEIEIRRLENLFKEFGKLNDKDVPDTTSIFEFIQKNKLSLSRYLSSKNPELHEKDFSLEARFVEYFKNIPQVYDNIRNIYLGSIISSYLEYQTNPIKGDLELLFDTNFIISLIDLNTPESTHTCNMLLDIAKGQGYKLFVLDITLEEVESLLRKKAEHYDQTFLQKKIDPEDIYNACDRRKLNKTDVERYADNIEEKLLEKGILKIPNSEKFRNQAKLSKEYDFLKKKRNSSFAALHDATALYYVRDKRGRKIKEFEKVNCWFVNNTSTVYTNHDNGYNKNEKEFQNETIKAEDFLNVLWISNPNITKKISNNELAEIGITRLISCTINESLPKSTIIKQLDENISKYAKDIVSDKDILRVATRIANKNLTDLEELNNLAQKDSGKFVKRLQEESLKQKEDEEKYKQDMQSLITKTLAQTKMMIDERDKYKSKYNEVKKDTDAIPDLRQEIDKLKLEKKEIFITTELKRWQRNSYVGLVISAFFFMLFLFVGLSKYDWSIEKYFNALIIYKGNMIVSFIIWIASTIFTSVFVKIWYDRNHNYSNINNYKTQIEIPQDMKN